MTKSKHIPSSGLIANQTQHQRRKWAIQEKASSDMEQTVFYQDKTSNTLDFQGNPNMYAKIVQKGIDPYKNTTCPFCLALNRLRLFLISTKKGYDKRLGQCPSCGQKMNLATLIKMETCTPEEYAALVFDYRRSGFWQKTDFTTWKNRMKIMKWTQPFWNEYKRLRGDAPDPQGEKELEQKWQNYEESFQ